MKGCEICYHNVASNFASQQKTNKNKARRSIVELARAAVLTTNVAEVELFTLNWTLDRTSNVKNDRFLASDRSDVPHVYSVKFPATIMTLDVNVNAAHVVNVCKAFKKRLEKMDKTR